MTHIKQFLFNLYYRRAVRKANKRASYTHRNIYVLYCGGKLLLMSKRDIVTACARGQFHAAPHRIMKMALYVAR